MDIFLQLVFSGIAQGSIYGLIALGFSVIFSTIRMGHFAQGDFFMIGAYLAFQSLTLWGLAAWQGVIIAIVGTTILMLVVERAVYRPLYSQSSLALLMSTMGMQFIVQQIAIVTWGSEVRTVPAIFPPETVELNIFGMNVILSYENIGLIVISALLMVIVGLFMKYTKTGNAMSAVSMNRTAAQLMGVKLSTIIATTFIIAAALAAVAGFLMGPRFSVFYFMGATIGPTAMTAAVLGGFGSMPGAMLGGVLFGMIETLCAFYISSAYRDAFTFLVLIAVLFWRPQGILGRRRITKV